MIKIEMKLGKNEEESEMKNEGMIERTWEKRASEEGGNGNERERERERSDSEINERVVVI
jgi:hypothetical protein